MRDRLEALLAERILVLDGAYGTAIQARTLADGDYRGERFRDHPRDVKGDPDLLNLTRPDVVEDIHRAYLEAGADIIDDQHLHRHVDRPGRLRPRGRGLRPERRRARRSRDARPTRSAATGSSPARWARRTRRSRCPPSVDEPAYRTVTFDQMTEAYAEQIRGLVDGGVDLLLIETIFDTLNAKAAIAAAQDVAPDVPLMISRHDHRPERPDALGSDDRGVLALDRARRTASSSA